MENITDPNLNQYFNHEDNRLNNPFPPEYREQNGRNSVRQVNNKAANLPTNNTSDASPPSTPLPERETQTAPTFYQLIDTHNFEEIENDADKFGENYNGIRHSQYAISIKNFTEYNKKDYKPLNTLQQNTLLLKLENKNHCPKYHWTWRNIATPFHSWTVSGLFTPNNELSPRANDIRKMLLGAYLNQVLVHYQDYDSLPELNARCLTNLLNPIAKLILNGVSLETPQLKEAVIILWLHVETIIKSAKDKDYPNQVEIIDLLWSMGQLGSKWPNIKDELELKYLPKMKEPPDLNKSVVLLWEIAPEHQNNINVQSLSTLLLSLAKLVRFRLLEDRETFNTSVTMLLPHITEQKDRFSTGHLSRMMGAMMELFQCGWLSTDNIKKLEDTALKLLPPLETKAYSQKEKDSFLQHEVAHTIYSVAKLLSHHSPLRTTQTLNNSVIALCLLAIKMKNQFSISSLTNLLSGIIILWQHRENLKDTQHLEDTMITLLSIITKLNDYVTSSDPIDLLWCIVKLVEIDLLNNPLEFNPPVNNLLQLLIAQQRPFYNHNIADILRVLTELDFSGLLNPESTRACEQAVLTSLHLMKTKAYSKEHADLFTTLEIVNMLRSIARLVTTGRLNNKLQLNSSLYVLWNLIAEQQNFICADSLKNILRSIVQLWDSNLLDKDNIRDIKETIFILLPLVEATVKLKRREHGFTPRENILVLWTMAKFMQKGMALNTKKLKDLVLALLFNADPQTNQQDLQTIACLLWALAYLGELIEIEIVTNLYSSLLNKLGTYNKLERKHKMMILWALMVCQSRLFLSKRSDVNDAIQKEIERLFIHIKDISLLSTGNTEHDTTLIMASTWLGNFYSVTPDYSTIISPDQTCVYNALCKEFSSLKIKEEESLHALPPVDIYFPDYNIVIEVQGGHHYIGENYKTKNGSTLLKTALLEKLGYDVIEILLFHKDESRLIQECIDKIQEKIKSAEARSASIKIDTAQDPSNDKSHTTNKDNDSLCEVDFSNTALSAETESKTIFVKKKKRRRRRATPPN